MTLSIKRIVAMLAASLVLAGLVAGTAGVMTLRATTRVAATWTDFERRAAAKSDLIADLRQALGYGGLGTKEVSNNIIGVTRAASETGAAASQALGVSGELSKQSDALLTEVDGFLAEVRAA